MLLLSRDCTAPHPAKHARPVGFEPPTTLEEHHWQKHRPTWALSANPLSAGGACSKAEELAGVTGARVLSNLLSPLECDALLELSERLGYLEPAEPTAPGRSNACCTVIAEAVRPRGGLSDGCWARRLGEAARQLGAASAIRARPRVRPAAGIGA